jgi:ABC-2 type transport system permease protein
VSPRVFLSEKLLSVSLGFGGLMLLTTPGVIGLGHSLRLGPLYDLTALLMVLLVPITPVSLAMLVVIGVLRWIPPARARTLATVLGFLLGAVMVIGTQLLLSSEGQRRPDLPGILPSTWPGHALAAVGLGDVRTAIVYLLATMLLAAALFGLAIRVAGRFFATGWATYQEMAQRRIGQSVIGDQLPTDTREEFGFVAHHAAGAIGSWGRADSAWPAWWPVFEKEWLSLRRDPQRVAMLAYPVILAVVSSFQMLSKVNTQQGGDVGPVLNGTLYGMLAFVAILMLGSITAVTVNGEGRSIYLLALAPLTSRDVLMAKWAVCAVPALAIVETILVAGVMFLHVAAGQAVVAALALAILVVALAALGLLINLLWPRLDVENPRLKASLTATIVSLACEMLVGLIATTLLILALAWWPDYPAAATLAGLALLLVTGSVIGATLVLGPRLLQHLMTGDRY